MRIELMPYSIAAFALVLAVLVLALWRKVVAKHEDDTLHVLSDSSVVRQQAAIAHRLEVIDTWGKTLTVVTALYVIVLFALYVYQQWARFATSR